MGAWFWRGSAAAFMAAGVLLLSLEAAAKGARKRFDVPSGPAAPAVAEFGRQAGVNLLASGELLANLRTNAVRGDYSVDEALAKLLAGTGLTTRAHSADAVFILPAPASQGASGEAARQVPVPAEGRSDPVGEVLVVGTSASQRSSIQGKREADTAVDMIVAEDVGAFPDRNLAEALSRIAGVSLERGDFGEGRNIELRGNRSDHMRIEIDGMALMAAGGVDLNLGGSGRGVELRELSADMLARAIVVKGATPDLTEGSLGGGVIIKTRGAFDFKDRRLSARVAGTRSSLNGKWTPSLNLVFADHFLGRRIGVLVNLSQLRLLNEGHFHQNATSGAAGDARGADFDNSPEKTFTFHPETVNSADPATRAPLFQARLASGGTLDFESTEQLLTKAAGARTKADCFAAFPAPTASELAAMASATVRAGATSFRSDALLTCLNQWNDYTPSMLRNIVKRNDDRRTHLDVRVDFRLRPGLSAYVKLMGTRRNILDEFASLDRGWPDIGPGSFTDVGGVRIAAPGSATGILGGYSKSGFGVVQGVASNLLPESVQVDRNHRVTSMVVRNAAYFVDNIRNPMVSNSRYVQAGASYRADGLTAQLMGYRSSAEFSREDARLNGIGYTYGTARLTAAPDGSWRFDIPDGTADQADASRYAALRPGTDPLAPLQSRSALLTYSARMAETSERQLKLDVTWRPRSTRLPFAGLQKWGASQRQYGQDAWTATTNGTTVATAGSGSAAVVLPASQVRVHITGCQPQAAAGALPCARAGYSPGSGAFVRRGSVVMSGPEFADFLAQVLSARRTGTYFDGASGRPSGLLTSWTELDVQKAMQILRIPTMNTDCLKTCTASDGQVYSQPGSGVRERVTAAYWMTDFDWSASPFTGAPLPWGMELHGNFGWRYVRTDVFGRAPMVFESLRKSPAWNPAQPYDAAGILVDSIRKDTVVTQSTRDLLPMLNLMFWPLKDRLVLRYSRSKGIARQPVSNLVAAGSCRYDQVVADANAASPGTDPVDMQCTGALGNPGLKSMANINQNLSLEWYPDKNTLLSAALFRFKGIVGSARRVSVSNDRLFAGTRVADPATGAALSDVEFTHSTLVNGDAVDRTGWEVGGKMAFSAARGLLRHMGLDANYTRTRPKSPGTLHRDLLTGDVLDPQFVPRSAWNASLWYDDGRWSARASLQAVGAKYSHIGPGTTVGTDVRNYNAPGVTAILSPPWNPGGANFDNATRYLDLKFSVKLRPQAELFAEVRNAARRMVIRSQGPYNHFESGAQAVNEFAYTGTRTTLGMNLRL